jgi:hypothetical protein
VNVPCTCSVKSCDVSSSVRGVKSCDAIRAKPLGVDRKGGAPKRRLRGGAPKRGSRGGAPQHRSKDGAPERGSSNF